MAGKKVGEVFIEIGASLDKLKAKLREAMSLVNKAFGGMRNAVSRIGNLLIQPFKLALTAITSIISGIISMVQSMLSTITKTTKIAAIALAGIATGAVIMGAKFETSMARLKALSGATGKEFESLEKKARHLGSTTEFTAAQAATAMGNFALAGFKTNEILTAVTPTLNFAAAAAIDIGTASDLAARVMGGMGLAATELEHALDVLTVAFTTSNQDATDLAQAMKFVGMVGRAVNKDIEEVTASLTALADAGMRGGMAGRGLRQVFFKLATEKVQKQFAEMGITVKDANGGIKRMAVLVDEVNKATAHLDPTDAAAFTTSLFGLRGGPAFLLLLQQGSAAIEKYEMAIRSAAGTTMRIATTMRDTLAVAFKIVISAVTNLGIELTQILGPSLRKVMVMATEFANQITRAFRFRRKGLVEGLEVMVEWLTTNVPRGLNIAVGAIATFVQEVGVLWMSLFQHIRQPLAELGQMLDQFFEFDKGAGIVENIFSGIGVGILKMSHQISDAMTEVVDSLIDTGDHIKLFAMDTRHEVGKTIGWMRRFIDRESDPYFETMADKETRERLRRKIETGGEATARDPHQMAERRRAQIDEWKQAMEDVFRGKVGGTALQGLEFKGDKIIQDILKRVGLDRETRLQEKAFDTLMGFAKKGLKWLEDPFGWKAKYASMADIVAQALAALRGETPAQQENVAATVQTALGGAKTGIDNQVRLLASIKGATWHTARTMDRLLN